jgi:regulator of CtrA degradation
MIVGEAWDLRKLASRDEEKQAVVLGPRIVASAAFDALYREGMTLVEEVAAYLDGPGRAHSRALPRDVSLVYATESMRLTTRLMQLASWLLLQRAVREGEISADQARSERHKVNFRPAPPSQRGKEFEQLPEPMRELVLRGDSVYARILKLEAMDRGMPDEENVQPNAVAENFARLHNAFGKKR